jgi:lysozyme family protein
MADFKLFYPILLRKEGGYANDPDDKGGETYKGVARNIHPKLALWQLVDAHVKLAGGKSRVRNNTRFIDPILDKMIHDFYVKNFWLNAGFQHIKNQSLANILADWKVNGGFNGKLVKELQTVIGAGADGNWGRNSSEALNKFAKNNQRTQEIFLRIKALRERSYRASSTWWKHGEGWMSRLNSFSLSFNKSNTWKIASVVLLGCAGGYYIYNKQQNESKYKRIQRA